jgi:hypothetical protein
MAPLHDIPETLSHDVAGNGELFWARDMAAAGARWLAAQDLAIVGGEVYVRHSGAWGTYIREWATEPACGAREDWPDYVQRGLAQALSAIGEDALTSDGARAIGSELMYFFACSASSDYQPALLTPSDLWRP